MLSTLQKIFPNLFKISCLKTEIELIYTDDQYHNIPLTQALKLVRENKEIFEETYRLFTLIAILPSIELISGTKFFYTEPHKDQRSKFNDTRKIIITGMYLHSQGIATRSHREAAIP